MREASASPEAERRERERIRRSVTGGTSSVAARGRRAFARDSGPSWPLPGAQGPRRACQSRPSPTNVHRRGRPARRGSCSSRGALLGPERGMVRPEPGRRGCQPAPRPVRVLPRGGGRLCSRLTRGTVRALQAAHGRQYARGTPSQVPARAAAAAARLASRVIRVAARRAPTERTHRHWEPCADLVSGLTGWVERASTGLEVSHGSHASWAATSRRCIRPGR